MAILASDLVYRTSSLISSTPASNGGLVNLASTVLNGVKNNLFPDVSQAERLAGLTTVRKTFLHINLNSDAELLNAKVSLSGVTPAADYCVFYAGTKVDTQDAMPTRPYGVSLLKTSVLVGDTSIVLTPEDIAFYTANTPFRIADKLLINDGTNSEYVTISAVTYGSDINCTVSALTKAYPANSVVAAVYEVDSVKATVGTPLITSASGTFNATGNITVTAKGTADQTWTLTFTSATAFSMSGNTVGEIDSGTVSADTTVTNPDTNTPYFTIKSSGFNGLFATGDTIVFTTGSATVPLWVKRVVPANTANLANDYFSLTCSGESY